MFSTLKRLLPNWRWPSPAVYLLAMGVFAAVLIPSLIPWGSILTVAVIFGPLVLFTALIYPRWVYLAVAAIVLVLASATLFIAAWFPPSFRDWVDVISVTVAILLVTEFVYQDRLSRTRTETRFRLLFEQAPIGMAIATTAGHLVQVNPALCATLGYTEAELLQKTIAEITHPDDIQSTLEHDRKLLTGEIDSSQMEKRYVRKDGQTVYALLHVALWNETATRARYFLKQIVDVTEQKQIERELEAEQEFALNLVNFMGQGLVLLNAEMRYEFVNPAGARMLGYTPEYIVGRSPEEFIRPEAVAEMVASIQTRLAGETSTFELDIRRADGTWLPALVTGTPRWQNGRVVGSIAVITDLSESRRIENELKAERDFAQQVLNNMGQGLTVTDADGHFIFVNQAYAAMVGSTPEKLIGLTPFSLNHPDDVARITEARQKRRLGLTSTYETRLRRLDNGETVHVTITGVPRAPVGQGQGSITVITDLTERKKMEEALAEANADLETALLHAREMAVEADAANRAKSQFLANVSHEIRTPMSAITGMTELLLDSNLTPPQRELAEITREATKSLLVIVNDLLDISKIEAGRLTLDVQEFVLVEVVEHAAELLAERAHEKNLRLLTYIAPEVPTRVRGDAGRLRQVLVNLIGNAIKFTDAGEVVVRVTAAPTTGPHHVLRLSVRDTGLGLAPEVQKWLFQPFRQGDASTTRKYGGTGLGLSISRHLVQLMGGEIDVNSRLGEGAEFWFTVHLEPTASKAPSISLPSLAAASVLLIEPDASSAEVVNQYLRDWGAHVKLVNTSEAALWSLRAGPTYNVACIAARLFEAEPELATQLIRTFPEAVIVLGQAELLGRFTMGLVQAQLNFPFQQAALHAAFAHALAPRATHQTSEVPSSLPAEALPPRPKILLVEDNPVNQRVVELQLERLGFAIQTVGNGSHAVKTYTHAPGVFALILMDCHMPVMDGFQATRALRQWEAKHGGHITIIALTANAMRESREQCLVAGMDDFLSKPFEMAELQATLERWLMLGSPEHGLPQVTTMQQRVLETLTDLHSAEPSLAAHLFETYSISGEEALAQLQAAIRQPEFGAVYEAAHSLKGSSASLGLTEVALACEALEAAAQNHLTSNLPGLLARVENEFHAATKALRQLGLTPG
ncbi:MAG: PAS domain S-box protein [Anaerolineales bacterium]|nr:PAS domain S-box protein [Anaerolineales bacterium]